MKKITPITPRQHIQKDPVLAQHTYNYLDSVVSHKRSIPFVNDNNVTLMPKIEGHYKRHDTHMTDTITSRDNTVSFRTFKFIPRKFWYGNNVYHTSDPQNMIITSDHKGNARYAYICINASSSDDGNIKFNNKHKGDYVVQFIRIDLSNQGTVVPTDCILSGPPINGGHGQTTAYNPISHQIWLYDTEGGTSPNGGMMMIRKSDLHPSNYGEYQFDLGRSKKQAELGQEGYRLGDDILFDGKGNVINFCPNTKGNSPLIPQYGLKIYRGSLSYQQGFHMNFVRQYIRNAGGVTIQATTYNPRSKRIYVAFDDSIISMPAYKLGHLRSNDIKQTTFNAMREVEGISADNNGNMYLLTDRSPEILKSPWSDVKNM